MKAIATNLQSTERLEIPRIKTQANEVMQEVTFKDVLKKSLENVNHAQHQSKEKTRQLALGEMDQLHDVMIAAEKASITLEAAVQIQRKVIDAYNEVMRMQI